jgi:hypothetical protein
MGQPSAHGVDFHFVTTKHPRINTDLFVLKTVKTKNYPFDSDAPF